jgi:biotin carboxyl carrier protein
MEKKENEIPTELKTLSIWDRDYKTFLTKKFENRKPYIAHDPLKVYSFLPGTIQKLIVKEGQIVKKGEPMLILESMKMMNIVRVPIDGKVKSIHVQPGEKIPKDHLIVEFE